MHEISWRPRSGFTLVELLVVIAVIGVLVALLLPAVQAAREASGRTSCGNNLKQISLACHLYHDSFKKLPSNGWTGQPLPFVRKPGVSLSWMLAILPQMEQQPLYDQWWSSDHYWNDPENGASTGTSPPGSNLWIAAQRIPAYLCPTDGSNEDGVMTTQGGIMKMGSGMLPVPVLLEGHPVGVTNYKGSMGTNWNVAPHIPDASFNVPTANPLTHSNGVFGVKSAGLYTKNFAGIPDGLSNTIMIGEAIPAHQHLNSWAINYSSQIATCAIPLNDLFAAKIACPATSTGNWNADRTACRKNANLSMGFASRHPGGGQFALADGSVRFLPSEIDLVVYRGMGTCAGSEAVTIP
ncbi:MAG TPA: DUF1559 domain-containing protein [Pirellulaceae bacterium]|jgi:prepilin-type N-terminal cleavage/methylation domain-containing protein/prepilin-type processing-associated H-X9-DG protein|nr:DUF1559 domain-containing protein [Pirellulaceae bacterium]